MSPPFPHPKQWKFWESGKTMNEGVFSLWNGHKPLKFAPAFFRDGTYPWTRSTTSILSRTSVTASLAIGQSSLRGQHSGDVQFLVQLDCEPVGHRCDEIGDAAFDRVIRMRGDVQWRHLVRVRHEVVIVRAHDILRLMHFRPRVDRIIHAFVQEVAENVGRLADLARHDDARVDGSDVVMHDEIGDTRIDTLGV